MAGASETSRSGYYGKYPVAFRLLKGQGRYGRRMAVNPRETVPSCGARRLLSDGVFVPKLVEETLHSAVVTRYDPRCQWSAVASASAWAILWGC
jgi:hypothetical protein